MKQSEVQREISMPLMMLVEREGIKEKPQVTITKATVPKQHPSNCYQGNSIQGNQRAKKKCTECGYSRHGKQETCSAKTKICDYCNGRNHFAMVCFNKRNKETTNVNQVEESSYEYEENSEISDNEDKMYLHPVHAVDETTSRQEMDDKWYEYVELQGKKVRMQLLDTGTIRCTIQHSTYQNLAKKQ